MTSPNSVPGRGATPGPERESEQQPIVRDKRRVRMDGTVTAPAADAAPATATATTSAAGPPVGVPPVDAPPAERGSSGSAAIDRIDELEAEVAERTADLQRSRADFQNYKRRRDREFESAQQMAVTAFVSGLLGVLDDIDRAREHEDMSAGFRSVADGLEQQVAKAGLTRFGTAGDPFDPTIHEALMSGYSEEVDGPTATVIVAAGYRIGDRVVRPARVMVMDRPMSNAVDDSLGLTAEEAGVTEGAGVAEAAPLGAAGTGTGTGTGTGQQAAGEPADPS